MGPLANAQQAVVRPALRQIVLRDRAQGGGCNTERLQPRQAAARHVVDLHRVQIVATHQWRARCQLHQPGLQTTQPPRQGNHGPATAAAYAAEPGSQLHQFLQGEHVRTTQLQHLRRLGQRWRPATLQAAHHGAGHILHPDRLKAGLGARQRHQGQVFLQFGKHIEEFIFRTKHDAGPQNGQLKRRVAPRARSVHQDRLTLPFAAQVH